MRSRGTPGKSCAQEVRPRLYFLVRQISNSPFVYSYTGARGAMITGAAMTRRRRLYCRYGMKRAPNAMRSKYNLMTSRESRTFVRKYNRGSVHHGSPGETVEGESSGHLREKTSCQERDFWKNDSRGEFVAHERKNLRGYSINPVIHSRPTLPATGWMQVEIEE